MHQGEQIQAIVVRIMSEVFEIPESEIPPGASTGSLVRWDSMGHMSLVLSLEDYFGIAFSEQDVVKNLSSLSAIVETVSRVLHVSQD